MPVLLLFLSCKVQQQLIINGKPKPPTVPCSIFDAVDRNADQLATGLGAVEPLFQAREREVKARGERQFQTLRTVHPARALLQVRAILRTSLCRFS